VGRVAGCNLACWVLKLSSELERDGPSDALIIVKTIEMAERPYAESDAHLQIAASIARKRVSLMTPQEEFSLAYFSDIQPAAHDTAPC